jgi:hypothetical protein
VSIRRRGYEDWPQFTYDEYRLGLVSNTQGRFTIVCLVGIICLALASWVWQYSIEESPAYYERLLTHNRDVVLGVRDLFRNRRLCGFAIQDNHRIAVAIEHEKRSVREYVLTKADAQVIGLQLSDVEQSIECLRLFGALRLARDIITDEFIIVIRSWGIVPSGGGISVVWSPSNSLIRAMEHRSTATHGVEYIPLNFEDSWYLKNEWN